MNSESDDRGDSDMIFFNTIAGNTLILSTISPGDTLQQQPGSWQLLRHLKKIKFLGHIFFELDWQMK